jgi:ubiquinone/menaquinone biosynthesis C-methylase UbiE
VGVGRGPGPVACWLAGHLSPENPITARSLTSAERPADRIDYRSSDAESRPFDDGSFDVTLSFTVKEEVDAERMLAELVRVTKPGRRIGVVVRATDMPRYLNVELPP